MLARLGRNMHWRFVSIYDFPERVVAKRLSDSVDRGVPNSKYFCSIPVFFFDGLVDFG